MVRKFIPFAVAIVLVLGCKKKPSTESGGGDSPADPSATYTIKIRAEQAGDKTDEVITQSGTSDINFNGKNLKEKQDKKVEMVEHIIDVPAAGSRPTKLTRTYRVARQFDAKTNTLKAMPFEGKTVTIEKKGAAYEFTADGKRLGGLDAVDLSREFTKTEPGKIEELMPKTAVKVGESWTAEPAAIKALGEMPFPIDPTKSKITGTLSKAYTKDGKQWGVIALDCDLAVSATGGKGSTTGNVRVTGTMDTVIDGSSREGTMTMNIKMDVTGKEAATEMKVVADMTLTKTVKVAR